MASQTKYPPVLSEPQQQIMSTTNELINLLNKHKPHSQPRAELRRLKVVLVRILDNVI